VVWRWSLRHSGFVVTLFDASDFWHDRQLPDASINNQKNIPTVICLRTLLFGVTFLTTTDSPFGQSYSRLTRGYSEVACQLFCPCYIRGMWNFYNLRRFGSPWIGTRKMMICGDGRHWKCIPCKSKLFCGCSAVLLYYKLRVLFLKRFSAKFLQRHWWELFIIHKLLV